MQVQVQQGITLPVSPPTLSRIHFGMQNFVIITDIVRRARLLQLSDTFYKQATKKTELLSSRLSLAARKTLIDAFNRAHPLPPVSLGATAEMNPGTFHGQNFPSTSSPARSLHASSPCKTETRIMLNLPHLSGISPGSVGHGPIISIKTGGWSGHDGDLGDAIAPGTTARSLEAGDSARSTRDRDVEEMLASIRQEHLQPPKRQVCFAATTQKGRGDANM